MKFEIRVNFNCKYHEIIPIVKNPMKKKVSIVNSNFETMIADDFSQ